MPIRPTKAWLRGGRVRGKGKRPKRRHGGGAHRLDDWGIGRRPALLHDSTPTASFSLCMQSPALCRLRTRTLAHRRVGQLKLPASISLTRPRQRRASKRPILANSTAPQYPCGPADGYSLNAGTHASIICVNCWVKSKLVACIRGMR